MVHGELHSLFSYLLEDEAKCFEHSSMVYGKFMSLLDVLGPNVSREDVTFREARGLNERLVL
jgi:hypothetical protein